MNDRATILKLLLQLKETKIELAAAKKNRDEWKAAYKQIKEER